METKRSAPWELAMAVLSSGGMKTSSVPGVDAPPPRFQPELPGKRKAPIGGGLGRERKHGNRSGRQVGGGGLRLRRDFAGRRRRSGGRLGIRRISGSGRRSRRKGRGGPGRRRARAPA